MKGLPIQHRTLTLLAVLQPIVLLFAYVILLSGPLAPMAITTGNVMIRPVSPALFGIGTVEARYTYRVGPTYAGRVKRMDVQVSDRVKSGQSLGEKDSVHLDGRIRTQNTTARHAEAQLRHAQTQAHRYEQLPLMLAGVSNAEAHQCARALLIALDVHHRAEPIAAHLSRVSIASSKDNGSLVILANEPSAPLHSERTVIVTRIHNEAAYQFEITSIAVTYNERITPNLKRIYHSDSVNHEEVGEEQEFA